LRFLPSDGVLTWLLKGNERRVLDLAAGTGQVARQLLARGLGVVAVEPDPEMREVFATRFPGIDCLDGMAERIPLADDCVDAVVVGSAWHWFDAPKALAEAGRVVHGHGRLGAFATNADIEVDWVAEMFTEDGLRAWNRGADSHRNMALPSADFSPVTETRIGSSQVMATDELLAWFRTHSNYLKADPETKSAIENRAARVLRERFPGEQSIEVPVVTFCWRVERRPR
jgi:SAM-dependent methyltransferase